MSNDANPLYYDYYGLAKELYEVTWKSKGSHELAEKIVDLFKKASSKLHVGIRSKRVSGRSDLVPDVLVLTPIVEQYPC